MERQNKPSRLKLLLERASAWNNSIDKVGKFGLDLGKGKLYVSSCSRSSICDSISLLISSTGRRDDMAMG